MVEKWLAHPSWTTAHRIYKDVLDGTWVKVYLTSRQETFPVGIDDVDQCVAVDLAWQVFFQLYVFDYELQKLEQNGGVINEQD